MSDDIKALQSTDWPAPWQVFRFADRTLVAVPREVAQRHHHSHCGECVFRNEQVFYRALCESAPRCGDSYVRNEDGVTYEEVVYDDNRQR